MGLELDSSDSEGDDDEIDDPSSGDDHRSTDTRELRQQSLKSDWECNVLTCNLYIHGHEEGEVVLGQVLAMRYDII